jgi:formylglycine-generating enzyme required for sulfatase activity
MFSSSLLMRILNRACLCFSAAAICFAATLVQAGETSNKIGITMVDIPGGSFQMGSGGAIGSPKEEGDGQKPKEEEKKEPLLFDKPSKTSDTCNYSDKDAKDTETPRHPVEIKPFQIAKTEVTLGQFKQFIDATGYDAEMGKEGEFVMRFFKRINAHGDDIPVAVVSWRDAQAFIDWLNKTDGGGYRLPSEAEWEYACRAGSYDLFCGTNNFDEVSHYRDETQRRGAPIRGELNAFGLYDMSGNTAEWVQDCWHDDYNGAPADGSAWAGGECERRVYRGASWRETCPEKFRASYREGRESIERSSELGFRVARTH